MTSAVDDYTFLKNFHHSVPSDKILETNWMYQNDISNSYDGGKISFDLSQFANNGTTNWQDWNRSLLVIPLVITLNCSDTAVGLAGRSDLALALKTSFVNMINNVVLTINGKAMINSNNFTNIPAYFNQLVSASQDDLKNKSYLGLNDIDNSMSCDYITAATGTANLIKSFNGNGILNNTSLTPALESAYSASPTENKGDMNNTGFYNRTRHFKPLTQFATPLNTEANLKAELRDYTYCVAAANADAVAATVKDSYQVYYTTAVIKLSDICGNYFSNLGLIKGAHYVRLTLDVNCQGSFVVNRTTTAGAGANNNTYAGSSTFNYTNPIQLNPTAVNITAGTACSYCVSIGITKPPSSLVSGYTGKSHAVIGLSHPMSQCRIYVPSVKLSLDAETALVSKGITKKVLYNDYFETSTIVSANNPLSMVVNNSVKNAVGLLVVPFISRAVNGKIAGAGTAFSVLNSPFYPAAPCPLSLTQLQVQFGGQNIFQQGPLNYTWEMFVEQIAGLKSTNGGQDYGLSSCLLSKADWENMYRYYYINLSSSASESSASLNLSLFNNNNVDVELQIFIISNKSALVNIINGQIEGTSF